MPRPDPRLVRSSRGAPGRRADRALEAELLTELGRLYADADAAFAGWSCPASTECCRFGVTGREPYVTSIELLAVRRAVAALGGPKAWRRAVPLAEPPSPPRGGRASLPIASDERTCPMLNAEGRCAIYASRPLGCRTFFCERASSGGAVKHKQITELVRRIKDLASRHAPDGDLGRPLTRAL